MRLEIGFIPHKWISDIPNACGYFPFAIEGKTENIVDFTFNINDNVSEFVSNWMYEINLFPYTYLLKYRNSIKRNLNKIAKHIISSL